MRLYIICFVAPLLLAGACLAQTQFARAVGGTGWDVGSSVVQTSDGGFAVAGRTESFGAGYFDLFLVKLSSAGALEWARAVGGTNRDLGYSVVQTSDGGFAVAGMTVSFGAGNCDLFLVKFDADGNKCIGESVSPTVTPVFPSVTSPSPIVASPSLTVTIVSPTVTVVNPTLTEICSEGIMEEIIKPRAFEISVSPNPFNSSCVISAPAGTTIEIFDIDGKCIGSYDGTPLVWSPEDKIGSGVYFIRATLGGQVMTKRVVLIR